MRGLLLTGLTALFITVLALLIIHFTPADDDTAAKRR